MQDPTHNTKETAMKSDRAAMLNHLDTLLRFARDVQWDAPPASTSEPSERRSSGPVSDPTADAALDDRRLSVREAVKEAEKFFRFVDHRAPQLADRLHVALTRWEGE